MQYGQGDSESICCNTIPAAATPKTPSANAENQARTGKAATIRAHRRTITSSFQNTVVTNDVSACTKRRNGGRMSQKKRQDQPARERQELEPSTHTPQLCQHAPAPGKLQPATATSLRRKTLPATTLRTPSRARRICIRCGPAAQHTAARNLLLPRTGNGHPACAATALSFRQWSLGRTPGHQHQPAVYR